MFSNVGRMDLVDALNVYMPSRHYLLSYSSEEGHMSLRLEGPYGWAETFIDDDAPSAVQLAAGAWFNAFSGSSPPFKFFRTAQPSSQQAQDSGQPASRHAYRKEACASMALGASKAQNAKKSLTKWQTKELGHEVRVTNPKADVVRSES